MGDPKGDCYLQQTAADYAEFTNKLADHVRQVGQLRQSIADLQQIIATSQAEEAS